jgi:hypothetical protein
LNGKTLLDIGTAEGIFALDSIDYVQKVYLFECDEAWIEPLKLTFQPYKEKVVFVHKYVSDNDDENCVSLDSFMENKEHDQLFIKMDIEGEELTALHGVEKILTNGKNISLAICTYHRENDAKNISHFLTSLGYDCEFTMGMMQFEMQIRKGICRGAKLID